MSRSRTSDHDTAHKQTSWRNIVNVPYFRRRRWVAGVPVKPCYLICLIHVHQTGFISTVETGCIIVLRTPPSTFQHHCLWTLWSMVKRAEILAVARPQMVPSIAPVPGNVKPVPGCLVVDWEVLILGGVPAAFVGIHLNAHARVSAVSGQLMQRLQAQPETWLQSNFAETSTRFMNDWILCEHKMHN